MKNPGERISEPGRKGAGWLIVLLLSYSVLLAGGLGGLNRLRSWALRTYDTSAAQDNWTQWRDETERQAAGEGPVTRRKAKSDEPPTLVLARDYYGTLTVIFVVLGTILFATVALMVRGAFSSPGRMLEDREAMPNNPGQTRSDRK